MLIEHDVLKSDPYRCVEEDSFYIDKETFYEEIYAKPSKELLEKTRIDVTTGNSAIKLFRINGYAGCGKTLFAHYIVNEYGYDDSFYYEFDQGEGKNYSLNYIRVKLIRRFSEHLAQSMYKKTNVLSEYIKIGRSVYGEGPVYSMLSYLFFETDWFSTNKINELIQEDYATLVSRIVDVLKIITDPKNNDINDSIKFLLVCDYYWRCAEIITNKYDSQDKVAFCLLDNLDNLEKDAVVDLYVNICEIIKELSNQRLTRKECQDKSINKIKYIVLFPTREVTNQRLIDGLRRKNKADLLSKHGTIFNFEMAENCASLDEIIKNRRVFWKKSILNEEQEKRLSDVESLMKIQHVHRHFSSLLNGNYSLCIDRMLDLWTEMPLYMKECIYMQNDKKYGNDYFLCSKEGTRGALLRMLLELFKKKNVYDGVTDLDSDNKFNVNGKLGLSKLNCHSQQGQYNVSESRLLMTFLRESQEKRTRINHIFEYLSNMDGEEICRYLYALSENIRDTWRRLLVFSANIPETVEDLYRQYNEFSQNPKLSSSNFSEVELCLSGNTYIGTVVPYFEFYLSRINESYDLEEYPPLYTHKSIFNHGERPCMRSISVVVSSVENCANEIYKFDDEMIEKCLQENNKEYIEKLFVSSNTNRKVKQSHLSRIIFAHISYIERFRRYILYIVNGGSDNDLTEEGIEINKRIISFIIRYLALFDFEPLKNEYSFLLSNDYLPENYLKNRSNNKTCKDIINLLKGKISCDMINVGYQNQKSVQLELLEQLKEIHELSYKKILKVELDKKH